MKETDIISKKTGMWLKQDMSYTEVTFGGKPEGNSPRIELELASLIEKRTSNRWFFAWAIIEESGYILTVASNYGEDKAGLQDSQKGLVY